MKAMALACAAWVAALWLACVKTSGARLGVTACPCRFLSAMISRGGWKDPCFITRWLDGFLIFARWLKGTLIYREVVSFITRWKCEIKF